MDRMSGVHREHKEHMWKFLQDHTYIPPLGVKESGKNKYIWRRNYLTLVLELNSP